jgi:hypothetical protein
MQVFLSSAQNTCICIYFGSFQLSTFACERHIKLKTDMDTSIQESIASMRRNVERTYNLPHEEREIAAAFFARADEKNAGGGLSQRVLDLFYFDMLTRYRFAKYLRQPTDPDNILYQ